jgi:GTPase SAR1 family protein
MVSEVAEHLLPEIRDLLSVNKQERIRYIQKDNWIGYSRAKQALNKLNDLYEQPERHRMPNLLITAPTNNGKTMIIEKFCRNHPPKITERVHVTNKNMKALGEMPVLSMQMLPSPDPRYFNASIMDKLRSIGAENNYVYYPTPVVRDMLYMFKQYKIKMLIIDEIHNMLSGRNDKQREFQNWLRYLGNELKIPIVCVGTKDAYLAIRSDPQLENRFEPFLLPVWKEDEEYESLLASMVSILPLKNPSNLNHPEISRYILEKSGGILGEIFTLLRRAAILAIETEREVIDEKILKAVDYNSPAERIRLFEQSIITG